MMLKGKTSSLKVNKLKKTNSNSQLSKRTILTNQKANKKEWVCTKAINKCSTNKSRGQMLNNRTKVNLLKWRTMGCLNWMNKLSSWFKCRCNRFSSNRTFNLHLKMKWNSIVFIFSNNLFNNISNLLLITIKPLLK